MFWSCRTVRRIDVVALQLKMKMSKVESSKICVPRFRCLGIFRGLLAFTSHSIYQFHTQQSLSRLALHLKHRATILPEVM